MGPNELDELVIRAAGGDQDAFTALVQHTIDEVRSFVAMRVWDGDSLDEAVQNTYVDCYRHLGVYRSGSSVMAWIKGIARHRVQRAHRERARWLQMTGEAWTQMVDGSEGDREAGTDDGLLSQLRACLDKLAPAMRGLVESHYRDSQPLGVLSERHQRSKRSLAVTMCRARAALRDCLSRKGVAL